MLTHVFVEIARNVSKERATSVNGGQLDYFFVLPSHDRLPKHTALPALEDEPRGKLHNYFSPSTLHKMVLRLL